jgi:uncharacterized protein (UPF0332 family)
VKPEAVDYLKKAHESLDEARKIYRIGLASVAARSAYYVAFHAAQALIISRTGKIAKTHSGVRSEFNRLTKDDPRVGLEFRTFLAKAYAYKEIDDYGMDKKSAITIEAARSAIDTASSFVECIAGLLSTNDPSSGPDQASGL